MSGKQKPYPGSKLRFVDIAVIVVFSITAFIGLYLFRQDLMYTIDSRDADPVGFIVIRNNIVQRRHENRVLWDRIFVDSPVFPGDLIRAADLSSATIEIASNEIFLSENTLIRIQPSIDGMGNFQVELREGNISVSSGEESAGILLNMMGQMVMAMSGSVLNATVDDEGIAVQVNEGIAELLLEGETREIYEGALVSFDVEGTERIAPSVVVRRPWPNARYLNSTAEMLPVDFEWSRINLDADDTLRLEIARDMNFNNNYRVFGELMDSVQVDFDVGQWYWRISFEETILRRGWLTVVDSSGPSLTSPVTDTVFRYQSQEQLPQIRFQWAERQDVSRYLIEISGMQDFSDITLSRQVTSTSVIISELEQGTWHWRVRPIFSTIYSGVSSHSQSGSFFIEQTREPVAAARAIEIPAAAIERERARVREVERGRIAATRPSTTEERMQTTTRGASRFHTIRAGDTLGRLARYYYGDPMQWGRIVQANNIENPDLIYPGQVFLIP
jgi:hypothetical protein